MRSTIHCVTTLYSHQARAVEKLLPSRVGALFMDMGTGKTRAAIDLVVRRQERISRVVWFCPVSLKETIRYEIAKHTDTPPGQIYVFSDRTQISSLPEACWYVVGIESMSQSDRLALAANHLIDDATKVVVDESDYIKGYSAKRTYRITRMSERSRYRLILTGTPISQGVVDLYSQMAFLSPKILGYNSFYAFARNHLEYSDVYPGLVVRSRRVDQIAAKIQPYVYQVRKEDCLDLPGKVYERRYHGLTGPQIEAYQQAKDEILLNVESDYLDSYTIFRLFSALQQIVSGFWNRDGERLEFPCTRIDVAMSALAGVPGGCKVIIWTKYLYSLERLAGELASKYGPGSVATLYGGLSERERMREIERFRGPATYLVSTQGTGGRGAHPGAGTRDLHRHLARHGVERGAEALERARVGQPDGHHHRDAQRDAEGGHGRAQRLAAQEPEDEQPKQPHRHPPRTAGSR